MRKRKLKNGWRLYLNPHDYRHLIDVVREHMDGEAGDYCELAIRFGGECGLRVSESMTVEWSDIRESSHPDVRIPFLRVRETKATSGKFEDGKYRSTILPKATKEWMATVAQRHDREPDEPLIDRSQRSVQKYVRQAGELAADHGGDEDFKHLSSHDLRAHAATTWLVRLDINPEVVMEIGGWSDYQNLQPYLAVTGDDVIVRAFREARGSPLEGYDPTEKEMPEPEETVEREQATIDALTD
jgi:integrase